MDTVEKNANTSKKLDVATFYIIIDCLVNELNNRIRAYDYVCNIFGFRNIIRDFF